MFLTGFVRFIWEFRFSGQHLVTCCTFRLVRSGSWWSVSWL